MFNNYNSDSNNRKHNKNIIDELFSLSFLICVAKNVSNPCGEIFATMDDIWEHSDCLTVEGFPLLLWETLQRLGYTEPPMYYYCEYDVEGVLKCEMHLHITKHAISTEFRVRCIPTIRREQSDTC
jgi:hypothetical protein